MIGDHLFDGLEHHLGARRTIQADHVHRPFVQRSREIVGRGAVAQGAVVFDAQLRDDHHLGAGGFARGENRFADFVDVAKRFEHQQIDAGFHQRVDLLAKNRAGFFETGRTERLQANSQRSDGSGDEGLIASGFAGDAHAGMIDQADLFCKPESGQALAIRAEGVGFENLGARFDVLLMNVAHQRGERKIQLVIAAIDENAFGIKHGPHGAIGHQNMFIKCVAELSRSGLNRGYCH